MKMTAIVVNYRTWALVNGLVRLLTEDPAVGEIVVVDNCPEETLEGWSTLPADVRYRPNSDNVGFAAAVNQGVRLAGHRYVALINPDVRPAPTCLRRLLETAMDHGAALVGPRFYWDDQRTFRLPPATGGCLWWDAALRLADTHPLDSLTLQKYWSLRHDAFWAESSPFAEIFLSGALLLVDRKALALPDGTILDERFFLYYEDTDLCARGLLAGLPVLCEPRAEAVHYWNQSPADDEDKRNLMSLSHRLFGEKYYGSFPLEFPDPWQRADHDLACPSPPLVDLGTVFDSPVFPVPSQRHGTPFYLEFSVSPLFIPFAQAAVTEPAVRLPRSVWERLAPGTYFCRIRHPLEGPVASWKWTKRDFGPSSTRAAALRPSPRPS